jgi:hypothetical protein
VSEGHGYPLVIVGICKDTPLGTNKYAAKIRCPLLMLVHCIIVKVYGLLMNSFMPFIGSLSPYNQTLYSLFAFCLSC